MAERVRLKDPPKSRKKEVAVPSDPVWTAKAAREYAFRTGEPPHLFLLRISRGEIIEDGTPKGHRPTIAERIDCAKACAQYFVPKLGSLAVREEPDAPPTQQLVFNEEALESLSPHELAIFEKVFGTIIGRTDKREDKDKADKKQSENRFTRTLDLTAEPVATKPRSG